MKENQTVFEVTYLGHSGFSVETEQCILIFDYSEAYAVGELPDWKKPKPWYFFVSHKHQDHYNRKIFQWAEQHEQVYYLLSNDLRMTDAYMKRIEIPEKARQHIYFLGKRKKYMVRGAEVFELSEDGSAFPLRIAAEETAKKIIFSEFCVETFRSTDAGTAFLVEVERKTLYHAGDLNLWLWPEETDAEIHSMKVRYEEEIGRLANRRIDAAFLPLDPRQGEQFYLGLDYFMRATNTRKVFPMHFWEDDTTIPKLKALEVSSSYRDKMEEPSKNHRVFYLS